MATELNPMIMNLLKKELPQFHLEQMKKVLNLLHEGNTVPFIARYRKEMTNALDEVQIREIEERYHYLENLEKRKEEVLRIIDEQEKLTPQLEQEIKAAAMLQVVEDLYRPYKQKRRTKATIAKEQGLEPLANWIWTFPKADYLIEAKKYLNEAITTPEEVLKGVHEILAEQISDKAKYRAWIRHYFYQNGQYVSEVKDAALDEKKVYEMYYDFAEPIKKMVSHRILATNRGEKEGVLKVQLVVDETKIQGYFAKQLIKIPNASVAPLIEAAYLDAYRRFIAPSVEREIRNELTEAADEQAIAIFGENLRHLLLQSPLKGKVVLGFDPAYRTGCKLAIMDATGKLLNVTVIYPHASSEKRHQEAQKILIDLLNKYEVDMVAIGNGTASRESEQFVAEQLKKVKREIYYVIVNEAGASVYSASPIARQEFPDLQVEERSAISIGRRLQDPLAELVKIEPKAVGVGQYQHDVAQKRLTEQLDFVVETVVNQVGVDVNTASPQLLEHVAGLNKTTAQNIFNFREENGAFTQRNQLKKVPRLGPKAYEQAVGFLRIPTGKNILDNTGIHPESYPVANQILEEVQILATDLGKNEAVEKLKGLNPSLLAQKLEVGKETVEDILHALVQPGRDMRDSMPAPLLRKDVLSMEDLKVGMELKGTVRNVIDFGAFVDIGVKQDGLVHLSKLSHSFVKHPKDVVTVGDIVTVWVDQIDLAKGRISLTMIAPRNDAKSQPK